jgi:hypothetical protein
MNGAQQADIRCCAPNGREAKSLFRYVLIIFTELLHHYEREQQFSSTSG